VEIRNGCGCVIAVYTGNAVGTPREKIRIEPLEVPIPREVPAPATPVEVPEKVPA